MTLTDAGPLFALVDPKGQPEQYERCRIALSTLSGPLATTWVAFGEAMYLAGRDGNLARQKVLGRFLLTGKLVIIGQDTADYARMDELMRTYQDRPMDLADASLVVAAETLGLLQIFSVDSDFYVYQLADGRYLELVPGPLRAGGR